METIQCYTRLPNSNEDTLALMCQSFERVIARGIITTGRASISTKIEISRENSKVGIQIPFSAVMSTDTKTRRQRVWQRLICYVYRTRDIPRDERPSFQLKDQQRVALLAFVQEAEKAKQLGDRMIRHFNNNDPDDLYVKMNDDMEEDDEWSGDRDGSELSQYEEQDKDGLPDLERACLEFCISLLDDINGRSDFHSVLLSGLAALGINQPARGTSGADRRNTDRKSVCRERVFVGV